MYVPLKDESAGSRPMDSNHPKTLQSTPLLKVKSRQGDFISYLDLPCPRTIAYYFVDPKKAVATA